MQFPAIGSVSAITSNVVETYLLDAEAWMEGQLAGNYSNYFPISVNSAPVLRVISQTRCMAVLLRRFYTQEKENASEWVKSWFDDAKEMIEPFLTGSSQLLPGVMQALSADGLILTNVSGYVPTFNVGPMEETYVDPNRLNDIQNARS
jgi:hypothetical protein